MNFLLAYVAMACFLFTSCIGLAEMVFGVASNRRSRLYATAFVLAIAWPVAPFVARWLRS